MQRNLAVGGLAAEPVGTGANVEVADCGVGRGEQDRVAAGGTVGLPRAERGVEGGGAVTGVDPVVVEVVAQRDRITDAQGEGGVTFDRISEPDRRVQSLATGWVAAMSRSTPPLATAASWRVSPTRRTLPPRARTWLTVRSRSNVPAIPASSITTNVPESIEPSPAGTGPPSRPWSSLAIVSVVPPSAARSSAAATADGRQADHRAAARRATRRPSDRARWSSRFRPAPSASCTRRPEVARSRTSCSCAGFNTRPLTRASSSDSSTKPSGTRSTISAVRSGEQPGLRRQDLRGRVELGAGDGEHTRAVPPAQPGRLGDRIVSAA